jgi:hypothetical protein
MMVRNIPDHRATKHDHPCARFENVFVSVDSQ